MIVPLLRSVDWQAMASILSRLSLLSMVLVATPAAASGGSAVPEPSSLALFALGLTGVLVGRHFAKHRAPDD